MSETTISRRSALTAGTLFLGAGLMAAAGMSPAAAAPSPTIERAEALILELAGILPALNERDQNNAGQVLVDLGYAAGLRADLIRGAIDHALSYVGPGNRVMDRIDAEA